MIYGFRSEGSSVRRSGKAQQNQGLLACNLWKGWISLGLLFVSFYLALNISFLVMFLTENSCELCFVIEYPLKEFDIGVLALGVSVFYMNVQIQISSSLFCTELDSFVCLNIILS